MCRIINFLKQCVCIVLYCVFAQTPMALVAVDDVGIDPRVLDFIYKRIDANEEDEDSASMHDGDDVNEKGKQEEEDDNNCTNNSRVQLPLRMVFRWMWKGHDNEQYPIEADLIFYSSHVMLHRILPNPMFPDRFNGRYFSHLSTSALYIKPTETNGYTSWYYQDAHGSFHTLKDARSAGFRNSYTQRPAADLAPRILKDVLLRESDMAQTVHHGISRRGRVRGVKRRRPIAPPVVPDADINIFNVSTISSQQPVCAVQWSLPHAVKVLIDYMVEVFPGHSRHILVQSKSDGCFIPIASFICSIPDLPDALRQRILLETPFIILGCLIIWSTVIKSNMTELIVATDSHNIQSILNSHIRPKQFFLSAADWLMSFEAGRAMRLCEFNVTAETLNIFRQKELSKTVRLTDMLDEIAFARHVDFSVTKMSIFRDTPAIFGDLLVSSFQNVNQ